MSEDATLDEFINDTSRNDTDEVTPPTELTGVPDDWLATPLDEVSEDSEGAFVDGPFGSNLKATEMHDEGYARVVQLQNIRSSEFVDTNHKYVSKEKFEELQRHGAEPGDLAIAKMSEPVARACLLPEIEEQYIVVADCIKLSVDNSRYNSIYMMLALNSNPVWKQAFARSRGSTRKRINLTQLKEVQIPTPSLSEQRKIATVLYNVDQAIQKTEEIVEQIGRVRKGVMQDLFSHGVRNHDKFQETQYGTIPVGWDVKTIEEIAGRIGSGGTPDTNKNEYYDGDIAWVKTDDLNSGLVETTKTTITEKGLNESAAKVFPEGTVLFAMYGGALGQNGRLGMEAAMNQACCGIVTDESEMYSYLLHQQLIHRKQQLTALSSGTHQQNISQSMIEKFEVFVPPLEEQKQMVEILQDIETTINKNIRQKEQLQRLKHGLMQDLLSGTVRTTDTNIEVPEEIAQYG